MIVGSFKGKIGPLRSMFKCNQFVALMTKNFAMDVNSPYRYHLKAKESTPWVENNTDVLVRKSGIKKSEPTRDSLRCGAIGIKQGMTGFWDEWGKYHPVTVLQLDNVQVTQVKTLEKDGVNALQVGACFKPLKKLKKPEQGHFMKNNLAPKRYLRQFDVTPDCFLPVGYIIGVRHFTPGQTVRIKANSKGKGFCGTIKRWNFSAQPASHGNSKAHRKLGSTGQCQFPGRVFPGKKMPGRMGNQSVTNHTVKVAKIDAKKRLIYLVGPVPGPVGGVVLLQDTQNHGRQNDILHYPTFTAEDLKKGMPNIVTMEKSEEDPFEAYLHDNDTA